MAREFTKNIDAEGVTYTFRYPSTKDTIEIDLLALKLRNGVTEGVGNAYYYSQAEALLQTLCVTPTGVDFSTVPTFVVEHLGAEVTEWIATFRVKLERKESPVVEGSNA